MESPFKATLADTKFNTRDVDAGFGDEKWIGPAISRSLPSKPSSKISSVERVLRTLRFEEVDRPPIYDSLRNNAVIEYYSDRRLNPENGREATLEAISKTLDATKSFIRFPQAPRSEERDGFVIRVDEWTEWVERTPFETEEEFRSWVKAQVSRYEGWGNRLEAKLGELVADFMDKKQRLGDTVLFWAIADLGFTSAYNACGLERFSYLAVDEPALLSEWLETRCDENVQLIRHLCYPELSPVAFVGEDIAYKGGLLFSPSWLRREFFPRLKRLVAAYHERGIRVIYHSDGRLWEVMDDLVDCGIDGLNPIEVVAGMEIKRLRREYPGLVLIGGIDISQLLAFGTPEEVKKATLEAIRDGGRGYFVASTSELHKNIPLENVIAMWETVWSLTME
ncbi:MAG TPA: hypothetical protein GX506_06140 [Firmicutes bacterium]|nr:hypothetical protein [Bacillota bacterium]